MSDPRWPDLSDNVRAQIARGAVPPPRDVNDPPDPIRDLRLELAIAEDAGNQQRAEVLRTQWLLSDGHTTWEPTVSRYTPSRPERPSVDELHAAADKAERDGDEDRAMDLRARALTTNHTVDRELHEARQAATVAGDGAEADRIGVRMLYQAAGEDMSLPDERPEPLSREQIIEARNEAQAEGDWTAFDRASSALLFDKSRDRSRAVDVS